MEFHDFPWPQSFSMTFQAWKIPFLKFQDFPGCVRTAWLHGYHCKDIIQDSWHLWADVKDSDVPSSGVCWWLKKGWVPMDVFSTGWRQEGHQLLLMECTFPPLLFLHCRPFSGLRRTWWDPGCMVRESQGNWLQQVHLQGLALNQLVCVELNGHLCTSDFMVLYVTVFF